jgi:hypothetical protein
MGGVTFGSLCIKRRDSLTWLKPCYKTKKIWGDVMSLHFFNAVLTNIRGSDTTVYLASTTVMHDSYRNAVRALLWLMSACLFGDRMHDSKAYNVRSDTPHKLWTQDSRLGCAMAQAVSRQHLTDSPPGQSMRNLWTEWHWVRSLSEFFGIMCQYHSTRAP